MCEPNVEGGDRARGEAVVIGDRDGEADLTELEGDVLDRG